MQFDKAGIKLLNADIAEALQAVADKHGISVKVNGGTYDPSGLFKPRVAFTADNHAEAEFKQYANLFGLKPDAFGKTFTNSGRTFTIAGLNLKARKRPVLATADDGKSYVFEERAIPADLKVDGYGTLTEVDAP